MEFIAYKTTTVFCDIQRTLALEVFREMCSRRQQKYPDFLYIHLAFCVFLFTTLKIFIFNDIGYSRLFADIN